MNVYLIQYHCDESGKMRWLAESVSHKMALDLAELFEADGVEYVIHKIHVNPGFLLSLDRNRSTIQIDNGVAPCG